MLQPLARMAGRMTTSRHVPTPDDGAGWDGDHAHWLDDLERRLLRGSLGVSRPGPDSRWDLEVHCGLMTRLMVVTGIAWQWTPHLRTAVRPRPHLLPALAALVAGLLWSPMVGALVASALIGELAYELINLRRAETIVVDSMAGALPPVNDEVRSAASVQ